MWRPEEFQQDFDLRHSELAKRMSEADWDTHLEYRGPD